MRKLAILIVFMSVAVRSAQGQFAGVTAELQLGQDQYLADEDVQLKVVIANRSGQPVVFGADNQWITFSVVGEHEYVVPKQGEMPVQGLFTLLSGQTVTRVFNPTPYFAFRRPGRYSIAAAIKIAQWKREITCKPVSIMVSEGVPLPNLGNLAFGVPPAPSATNAAPEIRCYSLLKASDLAELKLYFRLTDKNGRTMRVFPLTRMLSFSDPEAQIDRANNLHVLLQTGAKLFTYSELDPNGNLVARQFHQYTRTRPTLRANNDGDVFVAGGQRLPSWDDLPAPAVGQARSQ
jgi:hypothetical protein